MRRFFFENIPAEGQIFSAPEDSVKHLTRVLRVRTGDVISASDGTGFVYKLQVVASDKNFVDFTVLSKEIGTEIRLRATALLAELKPDAMEEAISHLSEHGIPYIIPFQAERSNSKPSKLLRRQKIADETVKKVGGLYTTKVFESVSFKDIQSILQSFEQKIVFDETETEFFLDDFSCLDFSKEIVFLIGPEGGFSSKEFELLRTWGCQSCSLGTRILRAPQAAASAAFLCRIFTIK